MEQQNGSVFDKSDSSISEELSGIEEDSLKNENKLEGLMKTWEELYEQLNVDSDTVL